MLKCAGRFFVSAYDNTIPFSKAYSSPHDLVVLLQSRGLSIVDSASAEHYLMHIGYYRLSAYMYSLLKTPKDLHIYKPKATFERVMMLYRFDKESIDIALSTICK